MTTKICTNSFSEAFKILRPIALTGVSSPYYTAALYCLEKELFNEAIALLKEISKDHWEFDDAIKLKEDIYKQQISKLQEENLSLRAKLATLNLGSNPTYQPKNTTIGENLFSNFIKNLASDSLPPELESQTLTFSFQKQTDQKKSTNPTKDEKSMSTSKRKLHS